MPAQLGCDHRSAVADEIEKAGRRVPPGAPGPAHHAPAQRLGQVHQDVRAERGAHTLVVSGAMLAMRAARQQRQEPLPERALRNESAATARPAVVDGLAKQPELAGAGDAGVAVKQSTEESRARIGRAQHENIAEMHRTHDGTAT